MNKKQEMFYYKLESLIYRISDHMPKKFYKRKRYNKREILSIKDGREQIVKLVRNNKPFMVGRYGTSEGRALVEYHQIKLGMRKDYTERTKKFLCVNAGFFPNTTEAINRWGRLMTELSPQCDVLGVMNFYCEGWVVENLCPEAILMPNGGIGSGRQGYTYCLKGKKVLVIHPMTKTIKKQYENHREEIFPATNMLPEFELITYKAVNTQADEVDIRFNDWFEALDYMTEEISKIDFDIALIGCGAYGFPLAARIKKMGKSAIHMGGAVQYLFGIKNARSDSNTSISSMYTDAWVYPDESERPKGAEKVEGGCYWAPMEN